MKLILTVELEDEVEGEITIDGDEAEELRKSTKGAMFAPVLSNLTGYDVKDVEIVTEDD